MKRLVFLFVSILFLVSCSDSFKANDGDRSLKTEEFALNSNFDRLVLDDKGYLSFQNNSGVSPETYNGNSMVFSANNSTGIGLYEFQPSSNTVVSYNKDFKRFGSNSVSIGDLAFIIADDGVSGNALWSLNRVSKSAEVIINRGDSDRFFYNLIAFNGEVYGSSFNSVLGHHAWRYNPQTGDLSVMESIGRVSSFAIFENYLYFLNEGDLYRHDGTTTEDLQPLGGVSITVFARLYSTSIGLFLQGSTSEVATELFQYDPLINTILLTYDVAPGAYSSSISNVAEFNDKLYFNADNYSNNGIDLGVELWEYDPNTGVSSLVYDAYTGSDDGDPYGFTVVGNKLYFAAETSDYTRHIFSVNEQNEVRQVYEFENAYSRAWFFNIGSINSLYIMDQPIGTLSKLKLSTKKLSRNILSDEDILGKNYLGDLNKWGSHLVFSTFDAVKGQVIKVYDPATSLIVDTIDAYGSNKSEEIFDATVIGDEVFFHTYLPGDSKIWGYNLSTKVLSLISESDSFYFVSISDSENNLFFSDRVDGVYKNFRYDISSKQIIEFGTNIFIDRSVATLVLNNSLYFVGRNVPQGPDYDLFKLDISNNTIISVLSAKPSAIVKSTGNDIYLNVDMDDGNSSVLRKFDTATNQISLVEPSNLVGLVSNPFNLTLIGNKIFMSYDNDTLANEPGFYDISNNTFEHLGDINQLADGDSFSSNFLEYQNLVYFSAQDSDEATSRAQWTYDPVSGNIMKAEILSNSTQDLGYMTKAPVTLSERDYVVLKDQILIFK